VTPAFANGLATVYHGDALDTLRQLPAASVHCCVTSPPYYGLRDYGVEGQLGLEKSPAEYVARMVAVFEEVRRVLRPDATLWLNIGDSYANSGMGGNPAESEHRKQATNAGSLIPGRRPPARPDNGNGLAHVSHV
jgi:DNA modification methylase